MSTYGTAVVVDSPVEVGLTELSARLAADTDADLYRATLPDGWTRVVASWHGIEQRHHVVRLLGDLGTGRAAIAEDYDEFGAEWTVLSADGGSVRTVHRRYVLNADPTDPAQVAMALKDLEGRDPRIEDVSGDTAAEAAADLFGVDPAGMLAAEVKANLTALVDGGVGAAFPWWSALGLIWPGPDAGEPLAPAPTDDEQIRINRAT